MSILSKHAVFVNEQVGVQGRLAKKYSNDPKRAEVHTIARDRFIALLAAITEADELLDQAAANAGSGQVQTFVPTLTREELDGLPSELLAELSDGAVPDKIESALIQVIEARGGVATLDQILVGLYRVTKEVMKRNTLTSKLYRMAQKGSVFAVPDRKGVYASRRMSEEEVKRLFGAEPTDAATQQSLV